MKKIFNKITFLNKKIYEYSQIIHVKPEVYIIENAENIKSIPSENDPRWRKFGEDELWGRTPDQHCWFWVKNSGVDFGKGLPILSVSTGTTDNDWNASNPQFIAYINGEAVQALDANHREVFLMGREREDVFLHAYNSLLFSSNNCTRITFSEYDESSLDLYYAIFVLLNILEYTEVKSKQFAYTLKRLNEILREIDFTLAKTEIYYEQIRLANDKLQNELLPTLYDGFNPTAYVVGSSHLDVAFWWTTVQTREKAQRTVATALEYMRLFPEYKFFAPQAVLYKYVQEGNPALFEEIKKRVLEGRWNVEGGTYVEPDCNLVSGESFIRQILFGKEFYKKEFGIESKICYIPDSFGFSGALPQILKKSGLNNFITSKISWNDTEEFPYDLFAWEGIDGSRVTANFITTKKTDKLSSRDRTFGKEFIEQSLGEANARTNYGPFAHPEVVTGAYENFKQKDKSDDFLYIYGFSDGGGGPNLAHIKSFQTMEKSIRNCPRTKFATLNEFVDKLNENIKGEVLDVWKGELYLQFHRGTLTSMGEVKRANRKAEIALMNLEFLCAWNSLNSDMVYPKQQINRIWETVLVNQFHDILPGSTIEEQYDITRKEYINVFTEIEEMTKVQEEFLCKDISGEYAVFNPHSFAVSDYVEIDGIYHYVENIPSKGLLAITLCPTKKHEATPYVLENKYYRIQFNQKYEIISIYDKVNEKEVLTEGEIGNRLRAYVDMPHVFDAWEIQDYYKEQYYDVNDLVNAEFVSQGGKYGYKVQRKFRNSIIEQFICIYENKEGIYFETTADWKEEHILLRTEFPVAITANTAIFDIQFGNLERSTLYNTPWERAMFETCGHKYADYSQPDYGVALMNDCKYGYDIHEGVMGLSLIKCATEPNKNADKGRHVFAYALYPHKGALRESKTIQLAYLFNNPLKAIKANGSGSWQSKSFARLDKENVILETIKKSESGDGIILRLYESFGVETETELRVEKVSKAYLCDMMEKEERELPVENGVMKLTLKPYEILTVKCKE